MPAQAVSSAAQIKVGTTRWKIIAISPGRFDQWLLFGKLFPANCVSSIDCDFVPFGLFHINHCAASGGEGDSALWSRLIFTKCKGLMMMRIAFVALVWLVTLTGCAGGGVGGVANAALEAAGIRKPAELPEAQQPPRKVALRLHAADKLNTNDKGQSLALVARIYKLKQTAAFDRAPFDSFLDPAAEKRTLGADLVEVEEVTLVPGQHLELNEKLSREAGYIGVVALYHAPAAQRWRLAFPAAEAERAGVTIGLHACAMSVGTGAKATARDVSTLSSVHCQ
jgi:type VI secretion system protein VasD